MWFRSRSLVPLLLVLFQLTPLPSNTLELRPAAASTPKALQEAVVVGAPSAKELARCTTLVAHTFAKLPTAHTSAVRSLTLTFDPNARRGLGGDHTIHLRCVGLSDAELVAVLVHEVGHVVDTGLLQASTPHFKSLFVDRGKAVYSSDPSLTLYGVSWKNDRSFTGKSADVVSGYALENPFEEFAETYALYVLHPQLLKFYAAHNPALKRKYAFMKSAVFQGKSFHTTSYEPLPKIVEASRRSYDVTLLGYDLGSFVSPSEVL